MTSTSSTIERKLSRLTMKKDQQLIETSKTMKIDQKSATEGNVLSCEISSICEQNRMIKNMVLLLPKNEEPSDNMPHIRTTGSTCRSASARKDATDKITKGQQLSIGLSDLGTNSSLSLPARPLTTGRLLPHIGHKHLHKDSAALLSRLPVCGGNGPNRKSSGAPTIKTQAEFQNKDVYKKMECDDHKQLSKPDQKIVQSNLSTLSIKSGYDESGCILNSSSLHSYVVPKHTPAPPNRKSTRLLANGCTNDLNSTFRETSSNVYGFSDESSAAKRSGEKGIPGSNFKPIISVRNLELMNHSRTQSNRTSNSVEEIPGNRPLPGRDRFSKLRHSHPPSTPRHTHPPSAPRHTHPPSTPPDSNKLVATVARAKHTKK